tara:strand:+ start:1185 stop:1535 length:351 start_codon:yes stop_codon:yes gene_type:complete
MYTTDKCVENEVYCNVSMLLAEILKNPDNVDSDWYGELFYVCNVEDCDSNYREDYYVEPLSFWAISERLATFLKLEGHPVTNHFGTWIWGRPTYGQMIKCDAVIENFVEEVNNSSL